MVVVDFAEVDDGVAAVLGLAWLTPPNMPQSEQIGSAHSSQK